MTELHKLYIEDIPAPWITWDKDLYKEQERTHNTIEDTRKFYGIELIPNPWDADIFFINRDAVDIRDPIFIGKKVYLFIETIEPNAQHELEVLQDVKYANDHGWTLVTESLLTYSKFNSAGLKNDPWLWRRPSRISIEQMMDEIPLIERNNEIISILDASHPLSHIADLVKAYLGAFVILRDEYGIKPVLRIFSHTDLPFEPFNEVVFEGFQSPKKVIKALKKAKLFIWPSEVETYPNPLMEAVQLGVAGLQYIPKTLINPKHTTCELFPGIPSARYNTVEELTEKIVQYFTFNNFELNNIILKQKNLVVDNSMEFGLHGFLEELSDEFETDFISDNFAK